MPSTNFSPICCPCGSFELPVPLSQSPLAAGAVLAGANAKPLPFHNIPSGPVIHLHTGHAVLLTVSVGLVGDVTLNHSLVLLPEIALLFDKAIFGSL